MRSQFQVQKRIHRCRGSVLQKSVSVWWREATWSLTVWQTNLRAVCKMCLYYQGNGVRCYPAQQLVLLHPGERTIIRKSKSCTGKRKDRYRIIMGGTKQTGHRSWKGRGSAVGVAWGKTGENKDVHVKHSWRTGEWKWKALLRFRCFNTELGKVADAVIS